MIGALASLAQQLAAYNPASVTERRAAASALRDYAPNAAEHVAALKRDVPFPAAFPLARAVADQLPHDPDTNAALARYLITFAWDAPGAP